MLFSWWRWFKRPSQPVQAGRRPAKQKRGLPVRVVLEALEDRILPSQVNWVGGSGDWATPSHWSNYNPVLGTGGPGSGDDAVIDVAGISVTHSTGAATVKSLTVTDDFTLSGGTLTVSGALSSTNTFTLSGGTLDGATVQSGTILTALGRTNTLNAVTLDGVLDQATNTNSTVSVTGGLTLNGVIDLGSANGSTDGALVFSATETLGGSGSLLFGANQFNTVSIPAGQTLTVGPNVTVHGQNGVFGTSAISYNNSGGSIINQGTIAADEAGQPTGTPLGSLSILTDGGLANSGTLQASNGGTLYVYNYAGQSTATWSNTGTLSVNNGTLNLGGTFTPADLGTFNRTGGTVNLIGVLNNNNAPGLVLNDSTGSWNLQGGQINGGTVTTTGSNVLRAVAGGYQGQPTLNGVTLAGTLDLTAFHTRVTNGLTLENGTVAIAQGYSLNFDGAQTLGGTGTVDFTDGNTFNGLYADATLTIGANVTVHGTGGRIDAGTANFINQGTISADVAGGDIRLSGTAWSSTGTLQALNGDSLDLESSWSNAGTIREIDSTVYLGGSFKTSALGTVRGAGGAVDLIGTLTNDGTLALDATTGSWNLDGGTINGGTVATTGGAKLVGLGGFGTLAGVTLAGTLDLTLSRAVVTGGLTLDGGEIDLSLRQYVNFQGTQTLGGTGEVHFIASGSLLVGGSGNTLTIGAGVLIDGSGVVDAGSGAVVNQGTIRTEAAGDDLELQGRSWTNAGTIAAINGGTVAVAGLANYSAGTLTGGTWQVVGGSTLLLGGAAVTTNAANILVDGANARLLSSTSGLGTPALAGLTTNATAGSLTLQNGASLTTPGAFANQGNLVVSSGSTLTVSGGFIGSGVSTVNGTLTAGTATVSGGGTLNGSGTIAANLANNGVVSPGNSPGVLTINGTYTQGSGGALDLEIGGTTAGSAYDQVNVSGTVTFAGTLNVSLINGFGPSVPETFTVVTAQGGISGNFATTNLPSLDGRTALTAQTTGGARGA